MLENINHFSLKAIVDKFQLNVLASDNFSCVI